MSPSIIEMAQAEAEQAETEYPDTETEPVAPNLPPEGEPAPDPEPEPDPEPAPVEPPSDVAAEKALERITKRGDTYVRDIMKIQAETPLGLVECPLCPIPGFVSEHPDPDVDPMQRLAVMTVLGEGLPPELHQHPNYRPCEDCGALGLMKTGSKRAGFEEEPCPKCGGHGRVDLTMERAQADARAGDNFPPVYGQAQTAAVGAANGSAPTITQGGHTFTMIPGGSPDPSGRLAGHPLWGLDPALGGF